MNKGSVCEDFGTWHSWHGTVSGEHGINILYEKIYHDATGFGERSTSTKHILKGKH